MHAVADDVTALEREDAPGTVVYTTLYDLIAAINEAIEPGEEGWVTPVVTHLLRAGHAHFLRDVDEEMLRAEPAPACLPAEELCVTA